MKTNKQMGLVLLSVALLVAASGCAKGGSDELGANVVTSGDVNTDKTISNNGNDVRVLGSKAAKDAIDVEATARARRHHSKPAPGTVVVPPQTPEDKAASLSFSFPSSLLEKPILFGGVITQVSDRKADTLGQLKLTDLPPFLVSAVLSRDSSQKLGLFLIDCKGDCSDTTGKDPLIGIPVSGLDNQSNAAILDLSGMGNQLDFASMLQNAGHPGLKKYKAVSAKTVLVDFSDNTLVFDIESSLTLDESAPAEAAKPGDDPVVAPDKQLSVTTRWYLKLATGFDPNFEKREPRPEAGFFVTERGEKPLIQRFNLQRLAKEGKTVKYYVKNVPAEHQAAIKRSFDDWNDRFVALLGAKLYSYEFIPAGDPRNALLVPGDPRFNILEWDLVNLAPYGGLGPSMASQQSGEEYSANVLIQGPKIVELYSKWFGAKEKSDALKAQGLHAQAEQVLVNTRAALTANLAQMRALTFTMSFAGHEMKVRAQQPSLEDPIAQRDDFEPLPDGVSFETYMDGYFSDMVTHELGHNLGLRHNFHGNLGAADGIQKGKVSRSIMEYLGRPYRFQDQLGPYDSMAVLWGYKGVIPTETTWFCTDEDGPTPGEELTDATKSAECSKEDATSDPYSFFEARLARVVGFLTAPGSAAAPTWTVKDELNEIKSSLNGLGRYAVSAEATSSTWTNFFGKAGRPSSAAGVKAYVLASIKTGLCTLADAAIAEKSEVAAKTATQANVDALRAKATELLKPLYSDSDLACGN